MSAPIDQLIYLANLYGINTSYRDMNGCPTPASSESLFAVLKALGAPLDNLNGVPQAIREKQMEHWRQPLEPITVLHNTDIPAINLRLPVTLLNTPISASLVTENGETKKLRWGWDASCIIDSGEIEGTKYVDLRLNLSEKLPFGYHKLYLDLPGRMSETLIISAPQQAYNPPLGNERIWGVFLPLYALRSRQSWNAGDFSDLETLLEWVCKLGGRMVGTLPLLPSFFDQKIGPGPYMPASRLFWNEFYLNISRIPDLGKCLPAQNRLNSSAFREEIAKLHKSHFVDYSRQPSLKRQVLEELSKYFFTERPEGFSVYQDYVKSSGVLEDYARFRATVERHGLDWHDWPQRMRDGNLKEGDYDEKVRQYYLYTQWQAQEQIRDLSQKARRNNSYLYLDVPVGVHPLSYDVWRERESFVSGINGGAPPDPVFTSGQNWSFPPIHPEKVRRQGYRYIIESLRHQLELAGMLRIDHMMSFHRLFWIPEGMENREGVYVNYRAEELYAILALESYRHQSIIIGEDLGIVPPEVRPMMEKNGIFRMFVGQYQLISENQLGIIPSHSIASLNTHDMYPFTSFWQESDIPERVKLKLVNREEAEKELKQRCEVKNTLIDILQYRDVHNEIPQDIAEILKAILKLMAVSPAYGLLVNLEDLWQETHPQNIPGTTRKQNWSRKARYGWEKFSRMPQVNDILCGIDRLRKGI
jgi:4-alpha-glucanotransferase